LSNLLTTSSVRPSWDDYFLEIVGAVAGRATCDRGRCGSIIVADRQILATGYVGSPPGFPHCDDVGHDMIDGHCVRTVHAEQNAFVSAARRGVSVASATLYTTLAPCRVCAMLAVTAGVQRVVAASAYQNGHGLAVLEFAGIEYRVVDPRITYVTR